MRRILLATLVLFFLTTTIAVADDLKGQWGFSIDIKEIFPDDSDLEDTELYGGALEYNFPSILALEGEFGYAKMDDNFEGRKLGRVTYMPLLLNVKARYPKGKFNPFVYAGLGVAIMKYKEEAWAENLGVSLDLDNDMAYQIGGGADFFISYDATLYIKLGYLWSALEAETSVPGYATRAEVDMDNFFVGGGLKLTF